MSSRSSTACGSSTGSGVPEGSNAPTLNSGSGCELGLSLAAVLGNELERRAVVAPALVGRRRAVVEDVAVVPAAALAVVLGARIDQIEVLLLVEHPGDGGEERRPARARFVLHLGSEK